MANQENEVKIERHQISVDAQGNVVIKNPQLRSRAEALLKDRSATAAHELFLDNCDCHCGRNTA